MSEDTGGKIVRLLTLLLVCNAATLGVLVYAFAQDLAFVAAAVGLAALLYLAVLGSAARRGEANAWKCGKCGYDLRGLKDERCPECGTARKAGSVAAAG
jgi:hypothetical protein